MDFLKSRSEQVYALTRIVVGFLFLCHGVQKLMLGAPPPEMPAGLFWATAVIETFGGLAVMVGFLTSYAAFLTSGTMAVAYFLAHQKDGLLPIQNKGELATLYAWVFLLISSRGAGIWSVDGRRG
jgi:putative oxidoreductase